MRQRSQELMVFDIQIEFTEYAPDVFEFLRAKDGISKQDIMKNLSPDGDNIQKIKDAGESGGKSGSFFFFSSDNSMLIKTMNDDEL